MNEQTMPLLQAVKQAGEDFEWYPTTPKMIDAVAKHIPREARSLLDVGAGDGRVLTQLGQQREIAELFGIEKAMTLMQAWPETITPVGTDLFEQNLVSLQVEYIFSNPPYSEFEEWAITIIRSGYARKAFLVLPRRWAQSASISQALTDRGATHRVIHSDDFLDAERRARAVVDIVEVTFPTAERYSRWSDDVLDPFDIWFNQNIDTFDREPELAADDQYERTLARRRSLRTIGAMVEAYNEDYARMEQNYRAIFKLDYALLGELGVSKEAVRDGIKKKMAGLKHEYWHLLFDRLDTITNRLATATKKRFLDQLTGRAAIAFTADNAYAVALWAIKHANKYFDEQLIKLFRDLSTFDGVLNYKSNQRTWEKHTWRYNADDHDHYALDYRVVLRRFRAIYPGGDGFGHYDYPGNLERACHDVIADIIAVLYNLGFPLAHGYAPSVSRQWEPNQWQDFRAADDTVLFQVKAFKNGNLHFRFRPDAIRTLNVEAGRLLGWLKSPADVVQELGYAEDEARQAFGAQRTLTAGGIKLLAAAGAAPCGEVA